MLDIRKRTGYLFLAVMMAQVILVSAQVQTKSGVRLLQAVTFELFSRVQFATASAVSGMRNAWGNYVALRGVRAENEVLKRRVADLEVKLQQEHALAAHTQQLQALLRPQVAGDGADPRRGGDSGEPGSGDAHGDHRPRQRGRRARGHGGRSRRAASSGASSGRSRGMPRGCSSSSTATRRPAR